MCGLDEYKIEKAEEDFFLAVFIRNLMKPPHVQIEQKMPWLYLICSID